MVVSICLIVTVDNFVFYLFISLFDAVAALLREILDSSTLAWDYYIAIRYDSVSSIEYSRPVDLNYSGILIKGCVLQRGIGVLT